MNIVVTFHYAEDDTDCCGDYWSVDVAIDGVIVANYGDDYHDKGDEKSSGFVDAAEHFFPTANISYVDVADAS